MNVDSLPIHISSIAYADSSGVEVTSIDVFGGYPNNLANWPFSGSPSFRRNMKDLNSRRYKNFLWAGVNKPWYAGINRFFLNGSDTLFPIPYRDNPATTSNTYFNSIILKEPFTISINNSILASNNLSVKARPGTTSNANDLAAPYALTLRQHELGKSVRELSVFPGKAGDQYEFQAGTLGCEIMTLGEPQLLAIWRHSLGDLFRPIHYFESDGTPFDAYTSPNRDRICMYNGNFAYTQGQGAYYFDKTIEGGSVGNINDNFIFSQGSIRTLRTLHEATNYFPATLNLNSNVVNTVSLVNNTADFPEWFDTCGETQPYNEQHMSYNMISTFVALTGDYMAEDEFKFLATPELLQYRPWLPSIGGAGVGRNIAKYPGGGDREFGRKLLCYVTAMRVTKGDTFKKFYDLSRHLCDIVDEAFRNWSNNYQNEQPPPVGVGFMNYSTHGIGGQGEGGGTEKVRIFQSAASSVGGNQGNNNANVILPWQRSYAIRALDAFIKYNDDPRYRDLLMRLGRSMMLFGIFKEGNIMPNNRQGVYNNLAASAPAMWPGMWKTVGFQRGIRISDADSGGKYFKQLDPSCFYHADDYMTKYWQFNTQTNQYDMRTRLSGKDDPNLRPGKSLVPLSLGGITVLGLPQFAGNAGNFYNSSRHSATEVSCGFSAGPDGYGYIVSGLVPTGLENELFLTEFNRQIECQLNYYTWVFPAAQVMLKHIKDSDALRFPRILEARENARDFIESIFLHPTGLYPSNYKTLLGHGFNPNTNQPELVTDAPIIPPKDLRASYDFIMNYAMFGPIP